MPRQFFVDSTQRVRMQRQFRKIEPWRDAVQKKLEHHITAAVRISQTLPSNAAVELELRLGTLVADRRGNHQRLMLPIASPAILHASRTQGFFVPGCCIETTKRLEQRVTSLVRHRPFDSKQLLLHTQCEKRFAFNVASACGSRFSILPSPVVVQKRRVEVTDVAMPASSSDLRISLAVESQVDIDEVVRRSLIPTTARVRCRKSYSLDSLFRVDISHVESIANRVLQREWARDLSKQRDVTLPVAGTETIVEVELLPGALRELRRRCTQPHEISQRWLALVNYLIDA